MEVQFSWEITSIKCADEGAFVDVIKEIDWSCTATDGDKSLTINGTKRLSSASENFIQYEDITLEQSLNWVWENGLREAAQASLIKRLDVQQPQFVEKPFPWM